MTSVVSSELVREWAYRALSALGDARAEIDSLNVFPVPDGDTGTNLYLTMESACQAVEACFAGPDASDPDVALVLGAIIGAATEGIYAWAKARGWAT